MNREYCIFKAAKVCDNCGECEKCDLNANKKCNNCGKCLEMEGFDIKAIKIDEIIEDKNEADEYEAELNDIKENCKDDNHYHLVNVNINDEEDSDSQTTQFIHDEYSDYEEYSKSNTETDNYADTLEDNMEYIDDIEGLSDLLKDKDKLEELALEEFPGFIRLIKK